jgi:hypothetical protein
MVGFLFWTALLPIKLWIAYKVLIFIYSVWLGL